MNDYSILCVESIMYERLSEIIAEVNDAEKDPNKSYLPTGPCCYRMVILNIYG